jgi:hypothetical protein
MHSEQINHRRPCKACANPAAKYPPEFASLKTPSGKPANLTIPHILPHTSGQKGSAEMLSLATDTAALEARIRGLTRSKPSTPS